MKNYEKWFEEINQDYNRLTDSVTTILRNLLKQNGLNYLDVSGRTKTKKSVLEKIKRKEYKRPEKEMTDLCGIRIILYFESDIENVSKIIKESFNVDYANSLDKTELLSIDKIGYRSVHFVCDLGEKRTILPEFEGLNNMKFEIQVRTVLQHAWAELAHDKNYKFSGKLPKEIERKLNLYAGMLELADKGFDELSKQIDDYIDEVDEKSLLDNYDAEIDSITLKSFVTNWTEENGLKIDIFGDGESYRELIGELKQFGITKIGELRKIIPQQYAFQLKKEVSDNYEETIYGLIRNWMLIDDWRKFLDRVEYTWSPSFVDNGDEMSIFESYFDSDELEHFIQEFSKPNPNLKIYTT